MTKDNFYKRIRTSMYAHCQHQRKEGKRGAHKLKRLAWKEEIATITEENRLEKIESSD